MGQPPGQILLPFMVNPPPYIGSAFYILGTRDVAQNHQNCYLEKKCATRFNIGSLILFY